MQARFFYDVPQGDGVIMRLGNIFTREGQRAFLQKVFSNSGPLVSISNLYIGLCNQVPTRTMRLADIDTEPTIGIGGYRRLVWRVGVGGDITLSNVGDFAYLYGAEQSFKNASDPKVNYSRAVRRFFMATVSSPTEIGTLLSVSGPLPEERTLESGQSISFRPAFGFYN